MKHSRFSEEQILAILQESHDYARGTGLNEICRKYSISRGTYYKWKSIYRNHHLPELKRLKQLELHNKQLKQLYSKVCLEKKILQDVVEGKL